MIAVVDCSAFVSLYALEPIDRDPRLRDRVAGLDLTCVPDIVDMEFHHAIRGLALGKKISLERAERARQRFARTAKDRVSTHLVSERVWELRDNLGAYDAAYIAISEALQLPLITCDKKQAAASGHHAAVEVYRPR